MEFFLGDSLRYRETNNSFQHMPTLSSFDGRVEVKLTECIYEAKQTTLFCTDSQIAPVSVGVVSV